MINEYEGIIRAVQLHESKMNAAFYNDGYNKALEDAINILPDTLPNIEMIRLNIRKLRAK